MKRTDLAYIAGLLDGEGTISISNQLYLSVRIRNTNREVLQWIQSLIEAGNIYADRRAPIPCYSLEFNSNKAVAFLNPLMPYIRIKKPQTKLAFEFQQRQSGLTSGTPLTDREKQKRQALYYQMSLLNKARQLYQ